jgi:cupin domain
VRNADRAAHVSAASSALAAQTQTSSASAGSSARTSCRTIAASQPIRSVSAETSRSKREQLLADAALEAARATVEPSFEASTGDETIEAGPGSFVFLPRDVPHTFRVEEEEPARMLTLLTPGGGERFFLEGGRPPEGPGLPPPGPPDIAKLQRVAPLYGMEIVGPPLPPA